MTPIKINILSNRFSVANCKVGLNDVEPLLSEWVKSQGRSWPKELSGDVLKKHLNLLYLPKLRFSGQCNGTWRAQIGHNRNETRVCSKCGGHGILIPTGKSRRDDSYPCGKCDRTGRERYTITDWNSDCGHVSVGVSRVSPFHSEEFTLKVELTNEYEECDSTESQYECVPFKYESKDKIISYIEDFLKNALEIKAQTNAKSRGDIVKGIGISEIQFFDIEYKFILRPLLIGQYEYNGKQYQIQIDAVGKELYVELPGVVILVKFFKYLFYTFLIVLLFLIVLFSIVAIFH